jgi:putative hydrolase of the HAD superfamily
MQRRICIVFDIDDTLYLERDYVRSGFEAAGRWAAKWMHVGDLAERCWRLFIDGRRRSIFNDALRDSGRQASPELVSALVEIYRTHTPAIALADDASEALEAISRMASIAIISDGPATSQSRKVEALGLCSYANPIVLTGVLGCEFRKPHPGAFEQVKQCRPSAAYVYVADNPAKDFAAPKELGWTTVRVRRPEGLHYEVEDTAIIPDLEIADCSKLLELVARL